MIRIIRPRDITQHVGISRSKVYELVAQGQFPKPITLSAMRVGFVESEVQEWLAQKVKDRDDEGVSAEAAPRRRARISQP